MKYKGNQITAHRWGLLRWLRSRGEGARSCFLRLSDSDATEALLLPPSKKQYCLSGGASGATSSLADGELLRRTYGLLLSPVRRTIR
ncbi:MAG: hypothetical protein ACFNOQ_03790 [Porphyromonas sp.]